MKTYKALIYILFVLTLTSCSGSKKAMQHPLSGIWDYQIETPEGFYAGILSVNEIDGALQGIIQGDGLESEVDLSNLEFAENTLTFSFDSGSFGVIDLKVNVEGDSFGGFITVAGLGDMPISGSRQMGEM